MIGVPYSPQIVRIKGGGRGYGGVATCRETHFDVMTHSYTQSRALSTYELTLRRSLDNDLVWDATANKIFPAVHRLIFS